MGSRVGLGGGGRGGLGGGSQGWDWGVGSRGVGGGSQGGLGVEGGSRGGRGGLGVEGGLGVGGRGGVGGGSQGWVGGLAWYSGIQGMLLPREHLPSLYNNTRLPRIPGARRFCKECHGETFSYENMSFGSCMNLTSSEKVSVALGELKSFGGKLPPPPPPHPHWIEP